MCPKFKNKANYTVQGNWKSIIQIPFYLGVIWLEVYVLLEYLNNRCNVFRVVSISELYTTLGGPKGSDKRGSTA